MNRLYRVVLGLALVWPAFAQNGVSAAAISKSGDLELSQQQYLQGLRALTVDELQELQGNRELQLQFALRLHSNTALAKQAIANNLDEDPRVQALIARSRQSILTTAMLQKVRTGLEKPDLAQLAHERYLSNMEAYRTDEKRRVAHILVTDIAICPCEVAPSEEKINELFAQLKLGADFAELAREHSHDLRSRDRGGELQGWFAYDDAMPLPFKSALFALEKTGQVSEPFQTKNGWHIVKLMGLEPSVIPPFEELKGKIEQKLWLELQNNALERKRTETYPLPDSIDTDAIEVLIKQLQADGQKQ